jgi:hypothetical protein
VRGDGTLTTWRLAAAVALVAVALAVVLVWRIGPVVLVLTATHGVHTGDALAAFPALGAVLLVRGRRTGTRTGTRTGRRTGTRTAPARAYRLRPRTDSTATSRMLIAATARPHHG